jgi:O-antigen ligase
LNGKSSILKERLFTTRANASTIAGAGVCLYLASFWLPLHSTTLDIPLIALSLAAILAFLRSLDRDLKLKSPLVTCLLVFLAATAVSILGSRYQVMSLRLSASFLPGLLLFILIAGYFQDLKHVRLLYKTLSTLGIVLPTFLLWVAWRTGGMDPAAWVPALGSPILAVANDVTLLGITAPFSLVVWYCNPSPWTRYPAVLSMLMSTFAVAIYQSGVGLLTLVAAASTTAALLGMRKGLLWGFAAIVPALLADGLKGFPLLSKFINLWGGNGRIPLWLSAWSMFLDAPALGQGPHTFGLFYKKYVTQYSLPSWVGFEPREVPWAHNLYVEILGQQGIIGAAALMLLLVCVVLAAWRTRQADEEVRILGAGAFGGLVGFCLAAAIELTFLRQWVVIMFFVLVGLIHQLSTIQTALRR